MPDSLADRAAAPAVAALPGAHLGLSWRPLGPDDLDAAYRLVERCEDVDQPIERTTRARTELIVGRRDGVTSDNLGGIDSAGELRAAAFVHAPPGDTTTARVSLVASIDPAWRGRGLGRALLTWQDDRARQILTGLDQTLPGRIAAYVDEHLEDRRRLYAAAGFSPKRTFRVMRRALAGGEPTAFPIPEGLEARAWSPELDEAVRLAHNETFTDHWGSQPVTATSWQEYFHTDLEPTWSMVAVDPRTGEVAGYALTARKEHQWAALGHSEGFTEVIGVRRPYRGAGLAKALLSAVHVALHRDGIEMAALDVDDENPSGAHRFYERMDYQPSGARILYTIEI